MKERTDCFENSTHQDTDRRNISLYITTISSEYKNIQSMNKYYTTENIRDYNKLHLNTSQWKIIQNTTERNIRIQSFPNIIPAVFQDPVNINMQNQNY